MGYSGAGEVGGLIQTTVCAEPGDSGGPLYDGSKALGITSGGGDCSSGVRRSSSQPPKPRRRTA